MRKCLACGVEKELSDFHRTRKYHHRVCKICRNAQNKKYGLQHKAKRREYNAVRLKSDKVWVDFKLCRVCKSKKNRNAFNTSKINKDGLYSCCIKCRHKKYESKREELINKSIKYNVERMAVDVVFKLRFILRSRLHKILKRGQKVGSAIEDLGCSCEDLKLYLESKFYPNPETGEQMNWDNYGIDGWQIDHIKPLSHFDLSDRKQFLEANNYINLQPLWNKDHNKKTVEDLRKLRSLQLAEI